jgi:uncharacterized protein
MDLSKQLLYLLNRVGDTSRVQPFHLAFPVTSLDAARTFYGSVLGCPEGRSSDEWIDFDFFGHQLVCHLVPERSVLHHSAVDSHNVPVPHFGVVLERNQFDSFADRLRSENVTFIIEPAIRFAGLAGEQATMFFFDPSGNALEFKAFADPTQLFAK